METQGNVAALTVIDYNKLLDEDPKEQEALLEACVKWGFFYLDLSDGEGEAYLQDVKEVQAFSEQYFAQSLTDKLRDTRDDIDVFNICGYKPMGLDAGNILHKKDGCEGLRLPSDLCHDQTTNPKIACPEGMRSHWPLLQKFTQKSHQVALTTLRNLSTAMGVPEDQRFENFHDTSKPSTASGVLQCYPLSDVESDISVGHFAHTDTGTLTIVFPTQWGLQVHSPYTEEWEWIPPHPRYATLNVGETLRFMSNGKLKSSLHRVVPCAEKWRSGPRYSTLFFLRANDEAEFMDMEGRHWNAKAWLTRKFSGYRSTHEEQNQSDISTGKLGFLGLLAESGMRTNAIEAQ